MKIVSADIGDDGVARLLARDDRLEIQTWVYACTDGNSWVFERNRHFAVELTRGQQPEQRGRRIYHTDWELTPDA